MRAIEKHGRENVIHLFADTKYEDRDLYDFNKHAETFFGMPIIRISKEMTPWELFRQEGLIGNDRFPICSVKLKRELLNAWMEGRYEMNHAQDNMLKEHAVVVLGFDYTEWNRVEDFKNAHPTWAIEAPMTEEPLWDKCKMQHEAQLCGFRNPRLYKLGFPHNNCGGRCIKAGISHWVHLYHTIPENFLGAEQEEQQTLAEFATRGVSSGHFTILKDRRGGTPKPLSLRDLRIRIESGETFPTNDWGGCGCGGVS